jgi:hypothetical protein
MTHFDMRMLPWQRANALNPDWYAATTPILAAAVWDLVRARAVVQAAPRPAIRVESSWLQAMFMKTLVDLNRMTTNTLVGPGILAPVGPLGKDGYVLIDGHYSASRCLEMGLPFSAYPLSLDESRSCRTDGDQDVF